ncbi:MAG: hypothetical protein OXD32_07215 [Endozoicomonadaceae bacterium]|nr:hypothetical protein [Endozoicomonadaceae bacterium]MCY4328552.1 hypothetical protein [Endozoicomonadaceae bacterium]
MSQGFLQILLLIMQDQRNCTALNVAANYNHYEFFKQLLSHDANLVVNL